MCWQIWLELRVRVPGCLPWVVELEWSRVRWQVEREPLLLRLRVRVGWVALRLPLRTVEWRRERGRRPLRERRSGRARRRLSAFW